MDVVRLNKPLTLMLPFRCYPLRLKHRLLESLGQVSLFMLDALHDGLPQEALPVITGLSAATVDEQLRFLSQHGFVEGMEKQAPAGMPAPVRLSERGLRTVEVDRMLHQQAMSLWLDAFTLNRKTLHVLATPAADQFMPDPSGVDFHPYATAVMPVRKRSYHVFDEMGRLRNLLNADTLPQLLAVFWPGQDALIRAELDHWEITLKPPATAEPSFLPVALAEGEAVFVLGGAHSQRSLPPAWLPVLALNTRYSRAKGLPWPVDLPAARQHLFEMVSVGPLAPAEALEVRDTTPPSDAMVLPPGRHGGPAAEPAEPLPIGVSAEVTVQSGWLRTQLPQEVLLQPLLRRSDLGLFSTDIRPVAEPEEVLA